MISKGHFTAKSSLHTSVDPNPLQCFESVILDISNPSKDSASFHKGAQLANLDKTITISHITLDEILVGHFVFAPLQLCAIVSTYFQCFGKSDERVYYLLGAIECHKVEYLVPKTRRVGAFQH